MRDYFAGVAGVQAPAFVERRIRCLGTDQVCAELQGRTKDEARLSLASAIELILVQSCDRCRGSRPPPRRSPESPGTEDPPGAVHTGHRRLTGPRPSRSPWSATGDVPEYTFRSGRASQSRGGAFRATVLLPIMAVYRKLSGDQDEWRGRVPLSTSRRLQTIGHAAH